MSCGVFYGNSLPIRSLVGRSRNPGSGFFRTALQNAYDGKQRETDRAQSRDDACGHEEFLFVDGFFEQESGQKQAGQRREHRNERYAGGQRIFACLLYTSDAADELHIV